MTLTIIIAVLTCITLILSVLFVPKTSFKNFSFPAYPIAPILGAILLIVLGKISTDSVFNGLTSDNAVNPLKILTIFISMTTLSVFLDEVGFFSYLANKVLMKAKTSQIKLFLYFYIITSVLTVFTSNDIIILTFTPFICYFSKNAKINPIPYLVSEFVSANTWSMFLIIGNPTNIYLAGSADLNFFEYLKIMALPTLFGGLISLGLLLLFFRKSLKTPIFQTNENVKLKNKPLTIIGLIFLGATTILLAISNYIGIEMWIFSLSSAVLLFITVLIYKLIKKEKKTELVETLKRAPWILISFVLSMFIIVLTLDYQGVVEKIANLLGNNNTIFTYGYLSFISCNVINNIPMSVLFSQIIGTGLMNTSLAVYATIAGSNIGAYLTPIGALAGIMWINILSKNDIKFSYLSFNKYGVIIGIPTMSATLLGLIIIL